VVCSRRRRSAWYPALLQFASWTWASLIAARNPFGVSPSLPLVGSIMTCTQWNALACTLYSTNQQDPQSVHFDRLGAPKQLMNTSRFTLKHLQYLPMLRWLLAMCHPCSCCTHKR
jgi:hypothetical protein